MIVDGDYAQNDYSQNFLAGSFVVGAYRLVGVTKSILYVVKSAGSPSSGKPIGAENPLLSKPEFDWNKDLIRTRHIKVKWFTNPIDVDVLFLSEEFSEDSIRAWAKLQGYKEVKILLKEEVELLD